LQQGAKGPPNLGPSGQQFTNVEQLRAQWKTTTDASGRTITTDGNRQIVKDGNRKFIQSNDSDRFMNLGGGRREQRGNDTYTIVSRPGGYEIINVTDRNGNLIQRIRRGPDRREV